jgi:very-short-patch-repair endonuclease/DNA polymerase III delta prime subunit
MSPHLSVLAVVTEAKNHLFYRMAETILSRLETSRKELLDLTLHNPLLNYRLPKSRGLAIVHEKPEDIYRMLVQEEKNLSFQPMPAAGAAPQLAFEEMSAPQKQAAQTDTRLQTAEAEDMLQTRLLNTYYAARTSIEEQGVNILYMALGMLRWFENDTAAESRLAPLVLVPVALERSSARERFRLRYTLEEVGENLSLQAKLKSEFALALPDLPDELTSIEEYFNEVEKSIAAQPRWKVERGAIELGFFSFGKFMIYNDLDEANWPEELKPMDHPILQSIFQTGFQDPPPSAGEEAFIDTETDAGQLFQVVDADSSQLLAMLAVHEGRNLVIQGPPGTGKSQTITNIIANAVGQGRKVLFVAEKLAALEVVKRRLDTIGLGEACLELHSHKANKKELHDELRRVLELGKPALQQLQQEVALLENYKGELNAYTQAVNTEIGKSGLTPYKVYGLLLDLSQKTLGQTLINVSIPGIAEWDAGRMRHAEAMAERIEARLKDTGVPSQMAFGGVGLNVVLPHEQDAIAQLIKESKASTQTLVSTSEQVASSFGMSSPPNREASMKLAALAQLASAQPGLKEISVQSTAWLSGKPVIDELISSGNRLSELHKEYDEIFLPEAWDTDALPLRQAFVEHGGKWYKFLIGEWRKANSKLGAVLKNKLPSETPDKIRYADAILEAKRMNAVLLEHDELARTLFGLRWQKTKSDWKALEAVAQYLYEVHHQVNEGAVAKEIITYLSRHEDPAIAAGAHKQLLNDLNQHGKSVQSLVGKLTLDEQRRFGGKLLLHLDYPRQLELYDVWTNRLPEIHLAASWNNLSQKAAEEGFPFLTEASVDWPGAQSLLKFALQKTWYVHLLQEAMATRPPLWKFERSSHEEVIRQFRKTDSLQLQYNRARAALSHWEALPDTQGGGQMNVIRSEFNKKTRHLPIRKLVQQAGLAIQAIKPVFMMSPLSIANFLPPGSLHFDLVIFDEASQVRPVEALGALLRGKQLIVVGDSKQLPPTSFFDSLSKESEDEESVTADIPSILGLCDAQGAPQRMLRWHYRSRHESLITLSNHEFYDNRLVVFPSPGSKTRMGLAFRHLPQTVYDRGRTRTNAGEAEAVADAVMEHARQHPKLSLGVVAFSTAQRQAIQDALELKRRAHPELESYFNSLAHEPFFVKNLENVQGDERDVIFISIGYGRDAEGYASMSFGPLNNEGGEKRLNVLITRARQRCEVFTNLTSDDIDLNRTKSYGVRTLKSFLQFAQHGYIDLPKESGKEPGSEFEEAVAKRITELGYTVHKQVGSKGFYLDLAVVDPVHPGRYILGIECDGAAYHSARSARDRDRLRQQVLQGIGWKMHRIWSTDWFRNEERELKRVAEAISNALQQTKEQDQDEQDVESHTFLVREAIDEAQEKIPAYEIAELPGELSKKEVHQQPIGKLAAWVADVVRVEGPVHFDEVARRIVEAAGVTRIGPRIREQIKLAARFAEGNGQIRQNGEFLWAADMQAPAIRDRSQLPPASRKLKFIAPEEIAAAIEKLVGDSIAIHPEAAFPMVAKLFGFSRVTEDMKKDILDVMEQMLAEGKIGKEGELLRKSSASGVEGNS